MNNYKDIHTCDEDDLGTEKQKKSEELKRTAPF